MIKFFRKIRRNLFTENKFGKYLIYAIGEIILVVIGILIALQINNQNEFKKQNKLEVGYYCKIKEDFEVDKKIIAKIIKDIDKRVIICKRLLLNLHSTPNDKTIILNDYLPAVRSDRFYPSKSAITDIISSGKLSILKNEELKESLLLYYSDMDNYHYIISENQKEIMDRIFMYDNVVDMGAHQTFYSEVFGKELMDILPNVNWQRDKNNPIFKKFEEHIVMATIVSTREKQVLEEINSKLEPILNSLTKECSKK